MGNGIFTYDLPSIRKRNLCSTLGGIHVSFFVRSLERLFRVTPSELVWSSGWQKLVPYLSKGRRSDFVGHEVHHYPPKEIFHADVGWGYLSKSERLAENLQWTLSNSKDFFDQS